MTKPLSSELLDAMKLAATQTSTLLKTLGNSDRLLLLCQLTQGEACVSDLEVSLGIQQPTLSQQLTVLRNEGLVVTRREGKRIYYAIADEKLFILLNTLYTLYCPKEGK
ncbi:metalloregulator ArsR/SmtB family transcription factor [Providencia stuartii]|uniref:Metalloregulator ArsR/SmtB family transcription factor n=1 Tax=Providencia stuartii TaxID=588 RepID=A0A1S1HU75_PROST|nr:MULTISPECIES: metalloregulator ArsR/SmtB family transcription factor [Providencia]MDV5226729.1 metalloregulator ArsR/SmtB family transcription factor [Providencia rettgeri]ELR5042272.1 metalloregulator ArsR/SmtB family transcription factor [Providencia stuartii]ELR5083323.1 metalloregulator ArsR/SmtB family transcription factor [Providencia stuartii]ELR5112058.1 metalloregulator ArsR/SmtB family transcription factor [Providencia stuartii]ELR5300748.1 metalloregulator ArsR/SmtB family transc